jgi:hypothetical protein
VHAGAGSARRTAQARPSRQHQAAQHAPDALRRLPDHGLGARVGVPTLWPSPVGGQAPGDGRHGTPAGRRIEAARTSYGLSVAACATLRQYAPPIMEDQVQRLRGRVHYAASRRGDIARLLAGDGDALAELLSSPDDAAAVAERLRDRQVADAFDRAYECVTLLVGSELDTVTPGERGLGRVTTAIPRLGGQFRTQLAGAAAGAFGPIMEDLVIHGFATSAGYDRLLPDGPATLRGRTVDEVLPPWVGHISQAFADASRSFLAMAESLAGSSVEAFTRVAAEHGLIRGLRKKRLEEALAGSAFFLVGAGADLYFFLTSRTDDRF